MHLMAALQLGLQHNIATCAAPIPIKSQHHLDQCTAEFKKKCQEIKPQQLSVRMVTVTKKFNYSANSKMTTIFIHVSRLEYSKERKHFEKEHFLAVSRSHMGCLEDLKRGSDCFYR